MNCCQYECTGGTDCPVRAAKSFPEVTGCSTKTPPAQCTRAQAAIERIADDSADKTMRRAGWLTTAIAGVALVSFCASLYLTYSGG